MAKELFTFDEETAKRLLQAAKQIDQLFRVEKPGLQRREYPPTGTHARLTTALAAGGSAEAQIVVRDGSAWADSPLPPVTVYDYIGMSGGVGTKLWIQKDAFSRPPVWCVQQAFRSCPS